MLPGLLLVVILGLSLALLRLFLVAGRDSPALVESLSLPGSQWKLVQSEREFGPFTFAQLARFAGDGVLTVDSRLRGADGSELVAGDLPGLFAPRPADWPTQPVHFQTFAGKADPVRLGRGSVRIEGGDLVLHGRRRRLFALRREDERIPVAAVENVVVDGRLVEFDRRGEPRRRPRLLRLAAPEDLVAHATQRFIDEQSAEPLYLGAEGLAARGLLDEAMQWLTRAVAVSADPLRISTSPALRSLHGRSDFQQLLGVAERATPAGPGTR